jgi:hypothetical protein
MSQIINISIPVSVRYYTDTPKKQPWHEQTQRNLQFVFVTEVNGVEQWEYPPKMIATIEKMIEDELKKGTK